MKTYREFQKDFIDEFWPRDIQLQIWSQCTNVEYIPHQVTYRENFSQWATNLIHLAFPKLTEEEIIPTRS